MEVQILGGGVCSAGEPKNMVKDAFDFENNMKMADNQTGSEVHETPNISWKLRLDTYYKMMVIYD